MKYIAYVVKGLEKIASEEIKIKIPGSKINETGDKRILFEAELQPNAVNILRTIDDLGLFIDMADVKSLEEVVSLVLSQNLNEIISRISKLRKLDNTFSLTIGAVGLKNYSTKDIGEKLSRKIEDKYQWKYTELEHNNFDIRLFIDHQKAYLSVRLAPNSLQHRFYKKDSKVGSLKPTIAATMVFLVTNQKKQLKIVDSFCGSGTILGEAFLAGNEVFGGDIDSESVNITKQNLDNLGDNTEGKIKQIDAIKTNWPDNYFDGAISNLPWNKQVKIESITQLYVGCLKEYSRIVKPSGRFCLLVSNPQLLIKHAKKIMPRSKIDTYN
jgi:23S rRNA G2445 N2-methylase RlmL